jgi:hypothetical protein
MLPISSPVRQYNDQVEGWFGLHPDVIVLGIRNEGSIFNAGTLQRIETLTESILKIPGVIAPDVIALPTVDDVTSEGETLRAQSPLAEIPETLEQMSALRHRLLANPLLVPRLLSADGQMTAIYIPIEKNANGKEVADQIRKLINQEQGPEKF